MSAENSKAPGEQLDRVVLTVEMVMLLPAGQVQEGLEVTDTFRSAIERGVLGSVQRVVVSEAKRFDRSLRKRKPSEG
jgi:hypothetical protein